MTRKSVKYLIAGLAGAAFTVTLFVGCGLALFLYVQKHSPDGQLSWFGKVPQKEEKVLSGLEQWAEKNQAETYARTHGLDTLYETVPFLDDTRDVLYKQQNFALVNERLAVHWASATTPFEKYRYQLLISDMGEIKYDEPEALLAILNAWVAHSPDVYQPLLIRGRFYVDYSTYFRGVNADNQVTPEDQAKYREYNNLAWADLEHAEELNGADPEIPGWLIRAAARRSQNQNHSEVLAELHKYYEKALALNPHHVGARLALLTYSHPKRFGSWAAMDEVLREVEPRRIEFPILATLNARAILMMDNRNRSYKRKSESGEADALLAEAYLAQLEQTPDELVLMGQAAYCTLSTDDRQGALDLFRRIGNRYPEGSGFSSLQDYHWWRIRTLTARSQEKDVIGTPQEKVLLDEALALDPSNPSISCIYLLYLERTRDDAQTKAFFESVQDPYLPPRILEEPLNYDLIKAVGLAGRSDEFGSLGTEAETILLRVSLSLAPDNAFVRLAHAEHSITAKDYDQARVHLERAREIDPNYLPALHVMSRLRFHEKRWDEAIASAREFLATEPSLYKTWYEEDAKKIIADSNVEKSKGEAG